MDMRKIVKNAAVSAIAATLVLICVGCDRQPAEPVEPAKPTPKISIEDDRPEEPSYEPVIEETDPYEEAEEVMDAPDEANSFYAEEISDELFLRMQGKSFPDSCTTSRDDLRLLHLLYKDINGDTCEGEMICNVAIADSLVDIFRQLYDNDYPIEKMVLIDEYGGDDDASMADNNTSCFNYREVSGTGKLSKHAYGLAVDLNPRYNPYIHKINGETLIEPENGKEYADRSLEFDYKIDEDDLAYKLFTGAGFTWGGSWKNSKDYQHFQYTP